MSTRGAIAKAWGDGWIGRYQHWDSYPAHLGKLLWDTYHKRYEGDLDRMVKEAIDDHPNGWSSYDPASGTCYCHDAYFSQRGDRDPAEQVWFRNDDDSENAALYIEWVYVLAPAGMDILTSQPAKGVVHLHEPDSTWNEPRYVWRSLTFIPWASPEPDWDAIEARDREVQEAAAPTSGGNGRTTSER